jgi:hypothetical protein
MTSKGQQCLLIASNNVSGWQASSPLDSVNQNSQMIKNGQNNLKDISIFLVGQLALNSTDTVSR